MFQRLFHVTAVHIIDIGVIMVVPEHFRIDGERETVRKHTGKHSPLDIPTFDRMEAF